jgi:hypothetical protein
MISPTWRKDHACSQLVVTSTEIAVGVRQREGITTAGIQEHETTRSSTKSSEDRACPVRGQWRPEG